MPFILGCVAIVLWGLLALFTVYTEGIPPYQLTAMTFAIATWVGVSYSIVKQRSRAISTIFSAPLKVIVLGVVGLFGYHLFYFIALKNAPPESASLIAYLWPLLIVLFSAFLPDGTLTRWHLMGAFLGLLGCFLLVTKGKGFDIETQYVFGYLAALACAFIWSTYSILSRYFASVKTEVVTLYCLFTCCLSFVFHGVFESTIWPLTAMQWLGIIGLGIGPVGAAFFCWDYAMKHGPIKLLGVMSYFSPLISTLVLTLSGTVAISTMVWVGCGCIVMGAFLSAKEFWCKNNHV